MRQGQRSLGAFLGEADTGPSEGTGRTSQMDPRPVLPEAEPHALTVAEATRMIKDRLSSDPRLSDLRVSGEMSNVKTSVRGHLYFTLKDQEAQMSCVMFARGGAGPDLDIKEGDEVIVTGRIDVYEVQGRYQLYAVSIVRKGVGDLYKRFMELKSRLEKEGLFAEERKRPLPRLPRRIGVVTSSTGSVFHDIVRVVRRRYPHVRITLAHASVQGERAAPEIQEGLRRLVSLGDVDVVIVGRGGGSFEDLWPFNDEALARAILASPVPVVSAVGHETDFSISDFVADRRAPTPSAAAEMVVPSVVEETRMLIAHKERLLSAVTRRLTRDRERLEERAGRPVLARPMLMLEGLQQRLDEHAHRLSTAVGRAMEREADRMGSLGERLEALSPHSTLQRGYSIALDTDGNLLSSVARVSPGDAMRVVLSDGRVDARAERVQRDGEVDT
jgi:exodeoxyribonuclease VII large subunit